MSDPLFDQYAANYNAALAEGLSVTGEGAEYYAQKRVEWLQSKLIRHQCVPKNVLDFGCGTGGSTPFLLSLDRVESHIGVDISDSSIDVARRKYSDPRSQFFNTSNWHSANSIDLAFCNGVFHHIPVESRSGCVKYVYDALKPGGLFALWENNPWNPGTRYIMSKVSFDRDAITLSPPETRRLMRSAGFEILASDFLFIFPKSLWFFRFIEKPLHKLPLGGQYLTLGRKQIST